MIAEDKILKEKIKDLLYYQHDPYDPSSTEYGLFLTRKQLNRLMRNIK